MPARPFEKIAPFYVARYGMGFAVFNGSEVIQSGFDCRGDAVGYAHDLLDEQAAEAEAVEADAYEAEMDRLHRLIDAQGGVFSAADPAARGRDRARAEILSAIDALGVREAA